jgi:hypothetical protein
MVEEKPSPLQHHVRTVYPDKALRTRAEYSQVASADSMHCKYKRNLKMQIRLKKKEMSIDYLLSSNFIANTVA